MWSIDIHTVKVRNTLSSPFSLSAQCLICIAYTYILYKYSQLLNHGTLSYLVSSEKEIHLTDYHLLFYSPCIYTKMNQSKFVASMLRLSNAAHTTKERFLQCAPSTGRLVQVSSYSCIFSKQYTFLLCLILYLYQVHFYSMLHINWSVFRSGPISAMRYINKTWFYLNLHVLFMSISDRSANSSIPDFTRPVQCQIHFTAHLCYVAKSCQFKIFLILNQSTINQSIMNVRCVLGVRQVISVKTYLGYSMK